MHHFSYQNGILHAEAVSLSEIAEKVGTPLYCYSTATLQRHYQVFSDAFEGRDMMVCFSVKANSNIAVLRTLGEMGAGMDVVSEGEIRRARAAGIPADRIVFSGVGKTPLEIAYALDQGIFAFNVESEAELRAMSAVASSKNMAAHIAFRVNPDVDAKTHNKITTGRKGDKFGIPWDDAPALYELARDLPGIEPRGVHMHIGSQITDLEPLSNAFTLMAELVGLLREAGHRIDFVNVGGGLGVPYRDDAEPPPRPEIYAQRVREKLAPLDCKILFEPGRMIAANAGIMLTRVIYEKTTGGKHFAIVDGAMNDLIRPTFYDAWHEIWPVDEAKKSEPHAPVDIVGPVCESSDYFAKDRALPPLKSGDLIAIMTAGAYGAVQSSSYNSRLLPPEVLVKGDDWAVVRARPGFDELLKTESLPDWLPDA